MVCKSVYLSLVAAILLYPYTQNVKTMPINCWVVSTYSLQSLVFYYATDIYVTYRVGPTIRQTRWLSRAAASGSDKAQAIQS